MPTQGYYDSVRIVMATSFPVDPMSPRGGVENVSVSLGLALAREPGIELHIVTADSECPKPQRVAWEGAHVHRLPWTARRVLFGALGGDGARVRAYITTLEPDFVHAHDNYGIMLRSLDLPRALTIHGFIYADTLVSDEPFARVRSRVWRYIETAAWARYPHIVSISPYVRERLAGIATGEVHDIDNPIADRFFEIARAEQPGRIFCAASISPRKNTLGLVEAFARVVGGGIDATLRLAGPAPLPAYADAVRDRVARLGLEDRVTLLPSLSTADVCRELSQASVVALVSLEENAPLTVQEAMAARVPVVTSNRCGMPFQVADGATGYLVDPLDPQAIAERLSQLLSDAELSERFGEQGHQVARERFYSAAVAARTTDLYRRATGATRP